MNATERVFEILLKEIDALETRAKYFGQENDRLYAAMQNNELSSELSRLAAEVNRLKLREKDLLRQLEYIRDYARKETNP